jgi:hypothetical protein
MTIRLQHIKPLITATVFAASSAAYLATTSAQNQPMSFFITSAGSGDGANLGGLAGADKTCQTLAQAAGVGNKTWHAYLSASAANGQPAVNARDRIGKGPWFERQGCSGGEQRRRSAQRVNNKLGKETSLTEKGAVVNGRGDTLNTHAHPDRVECGRDAVEQGRQHVRELVQEHGRHRARGHHDKQGGGDAPNSWELRTRYEGLQPDGSGC